MWDECQEADPDRISTQTGARGGGGAVDVVVTPALSSQVKRAARVRPRVSSSRRLSASSIAAAMASTSGRVEEHGGFSCDLRDRTRVRRGDRTPAGHRLENRQPEALVEAGVHEARARRYSEARCSAGTEPRFSTPSGSGSSRSRPPPVRTSRSCGRVSRSVANASKSRVWFLCGHGRAGYRRIGSGSSSPSLNTEWSIACGTTHATGPEIQELDSAAAHELARHDDGRGASGRAVVRDAPERLASRAEELGKVSMLRVVQRDDGRCLCSRRGHGQRVVEDVELGDLRVVTARVRRAASAIVAMRSGPRASRRILDLDRREKPSAASFARAGTSTTYSCVPPRQRAVSCRAYVSDPPLSPGDSVRSEMPTRTLSAYSPFQLANPTTGVESSDALRRRQKWRFCRDFFDTEPRRRRGALPCAARGGTPVRRRPRRAAATRTTVAPPAQKPSASGRSPQTDRSAFGPAFAGASAHRSRRFCES